MNAGLISTVTAKAVGLDYSGARRRLVSVSVPGKPPICWTMDYQTARSVANLILKAADIAENLKPYEFET